MKESISNISLRIVVVFLSLVLIWKIFMESKKISVNKLETQNQTDSLIRIIDSLHYEVFIEHTNTDRYEIALYNLRERDSVAAAKFEEELSNTE